MSIAELIRELEALDWEYPGVAIHDAAKIIGECTSGDVGGYMTALPADEADDLAWKSNEPTTHYKYLLRRARQDRYQIWAHEYKPAMLMREGYATTVHDHRYWFASKLLSGSFTEIRYDQPRGTSARVREVGRSRRSAGEVYVVDPECLHTICDIQEQTWTLIIRSRAAKRYSRLVHVDKHEVVELPSMRERFRAFGAKLQKL